MVGQVAALSCLLSEVPLILARGVERSRRAFSPISPISRDRERSIQPPEYKSTPSVPSAKVISRQLSRSATRCEMRRAGVVNVHFLALRQPQTQQPPHAPYASSDAPDFRNSWLRASNAGRLITFREPGPARTKRPLSQAKKQSLNSSCGPVKKLTPASS